MESLVIIFAMFTGFVLFIGLLDVISASNMDRNNFPTKSEKRSYWRSKD